MYITIINGGIEQLRKWQADGKQLIGNTCTYNMGNDLMTSFLLCKDIKFYVLNFNPAQCLDPVSLLIKEYCSNYDFFNILLVGLHLSFVVTHIIISLVSQENV